MKKLQFSLFGLRSHENEALRENQRQTWLSLGASPKTASDAATAFAKSNAGIPLQESDRRALSQAREQTIRVKRQQDRDRTSH